jgi:hypothetical protein
MPETHISAPITDHIAHFWDDSIQSYDFDMQDSNTIIAENVSGMICT